MKFNKIPKFILIFIFIMTCQSAGIIGALFTTPAIPTWYAQLNKPSFSPPNWIFAPVWTTLYTLMGISLYIIWNKGQKSAKTTTKKLASWGLKIFAFHLFLNSLWSILFFGLRNPFAAFLEILLLVSSLIYIMKIFFKIDKIAAYLLIPYLIWVSFASFLNFTIWRLNNKSLKTTVFAQEFNYQKAYSDYAYTKDNYLAKLSDFRKKMDSYTNNPTLSLKEEARISLYNLIIFRHEYIRTYFTAIRMRLLESKDISQNMRDEALSKISTEIKWYEEHKNIFSSQESLEGLLNKSSEEDNRFTITSTPLINYSLIVIGYGDLNTQEKKHTEIYQKLKKEAGEIVNLGRADASLFERWFKDIETEFELLDKIQTEIEKETGNMFSKETYIQKRAFNEANKNLEPARQSLLKINGYIYELETVIEEKR